MDIVEKLNLKMPSLSWTVDDMVAFLKSGTTKEYSGCEQLFGNYTIAAQLCPIYDKTVGLYGYDHKNGKFNLAPLTKGRNDYMIMLGKHSLKPAERELLSYCNRSTGLHMDIDYTYYGSKNFTEVFYRLSDQKVFVENRIPAVFFTSGITMNTNKTRDNAENLNYEVLRKRLELIYHWIESML